MCARDLRDDLASIGCENFFCAREELARAAPN
jgi:hypothetical protein